MSRHRLTVAGAGIAATLLTLLGTAPAHAATTSYTTGTDPVQVAAGWLTTQFVDASKLPTPAGDHFISGEFGGQFFVNYGENADVVFALAAAKSGGAAISKAMDYLASNVDAYGDISNSDGFGPSDGAIGKMALAAIVAGRNPSSFGGFDLLHTLKTDECPASSTTCTPGSPANIFSSISASFVVLAEARAGGANAPDGALVSYLASLQCASGGFSSGTTACGSGTAGVDATSYAIMALAAAGGRDADVAKAVTWLSGQENAGHYWGTQNVNSTGLAAAALASRGVGETDAQAWLLSQQIGAGQPGAGALKYQGAFTATLTTATSPSVLATAQAIPALVSGASLASVSATGAASGATLLAPTATATTTSATGHGFVAGESVQAVLRSTPVTLGTAKAAADGTVTLTYKIPAGTAAGTHTVTLTGLTSGLAASHPVSVAAAVGATTPTSSGSSGSGSAQGETGSGSEPVAATGQDRRALFGFGAGGVLAVLVGAGLLALARRRTS